MRPDPRLTDEVLVVPLNLQVKYPILTPNLLQRFNTNSALCRLKPLPNLKVPNRNLVIPVQRPKRMTTRPPKDRTPDKPNLVNVVV